MESPRISFSDDLLLTNASVAHLPLVNPTCASVDFDFDVPADASESFLADDLFSNGVLLPTLPFPTPKVAPVTLEVSVQSFGKPCKNHEESADARKRSPTRKSLWPFSRSSSLNVDDGRKAEPCSSKLVRSKSAEPHYKQRHARENSSHGINAKSFSLKRKYGTSLERIPNDSKTRRYYYSGGSRRSYGAGVRIGFVLNVSLPSKLGILKALSSLLMWNCGGKRTRKEGAAAS